MHVKNRLSDRQAQHLLCPGAYDQGQSGHEEEEHRQIQLVRDARRLNHHFGVSAAYHDDPFQSHSLLISLAAISRRLV